MALTMYTTAWCGYCRRLAAQLDRAQIPFEKVDIEQVPEAVAIVEQANDGNRTVPTLLFDDGSTLTNPSVKEVQQRLASLAG
ncbi:MAG: mycoredoxin [Actinomycetia bacterium]|nr:mycoredoxin [Actinomycetes bacterium]